MRLCEKSKSADTEVSEEEGGGGGAPGTRAVHGEDHGEVGCLPADHRGPASKLRMVILLFCSAAVRPHLESCAQSWPPQTHRLTQASLTKDHKDDLRNRSI